MKSGTRNQRRGGAERLDSARLSDLGCPGATQDPSRLSQPESHRGCVGLRHWWLRPEHVALYGVAGRRGIRIRQVKQPPAGRQAGPPAVTASGGKRRNVLGAVAPEKNDCNSPKRSDDNPDESRRPETTTTAHDFRPITGVIFALRSRFALTHGILAFLLTTSFRNGVIDRSSRRNVQLLPYQPAMAQRIQGGLQLHRLILGLPAEVAKRVPGRPGRAPAWCAGRGGSVGSWPPAAPSGLRTGRSPAAARTGAAPTGCRSTA